MTYYTTWPVTLRKIPLLYLIFWCGNFVERYSFRIVSGESPETIRKLYLSTQFPHQEIRWNYGIFRSVIGYIMISFNDHYISRIHVETDHDFKLHWTFLQSIIFLLFWLPILEKQKVNTNPDACNFWSL